MLRRNAMVGQVVECSAPGKVILFGEHAVVYGRPAIAVPVTQVRATATITPAEPGSGLVIAAPDIRKRFLLADAPQDEPLALAARLVTSRLGVPEPDAVCEVSSTIPVASGMGSGAAVSAALIRALSTYLGCASDAAPLSALVFEVEKLHHGTPSGIDNTVVSYEQPVYFARDRPVEALTVGAPFSLVIGDTGKHSSTKSAIERVRRGWQRDTVHYDALFDLVSEVVGEARAAITAGRVSALGPMMDENHDLLVEMGVSSPRLDDLVEAARFAGALGAKLSGAGRGGNMIALVEEDLVEDVVEALKDAGAARVICTTVSQSVE
jgi:mevalonate kinase